MLRVTPTTDLTRNGFSEAAIQAWLAIPKPVFFSAGIASNLATESTEQVEASHLQFGGRSVLQSYRERCGEAYNALLDQLTRETAPLDKGCHLSICIPVAAHQEANYIGRCLEGLSHQTVSPKSFEIVLLLNHPDKSRAGDPILPF